MALSKLNKIPQLKLNKIPLLSRLKSKIFMNNYIHMSINVLLLSALMLFTTGCVETSSDNTQPDGNTADISDTTYGNSTDGISEDISDTSTDSISDNISDTSTDNISDNTSDTSTGNMSDNTSDTSTDDMPTAPVFTITHADNNTSVTDELSAVSVDLSSVTETEYLISDAGDYELSGTFKGKITVSAEENIVHIILAGVNISSSGGSAVEIQSAGKVIITLKDGTENIISDSANYKNTDTESCIYSVCDLTINGTGSLKVYGYYKDAIYSKDIVKLLDCTVFIQSKRNAVRGNDGILVSTKSLDIESEGNGLKTTKTGKNNKGVIDVCAGDITIIAGNSAFVSASDVYIRDCSIYTKSIISDFDVDGECHIGKGCFADE